MKFLSIRFWFLFLILKSFSYCFQNVPLQSGQRVFRKSLNTLSYGNILRSKVLDLDEQTRKRKIIGHFSKRFLFLGLCPLNKVSKHVEAWPQHMKWLKVAARYKPTRLAVVAEEYMMLSADRSRPHCQMLFMDSNNAINAFAYGLRTEPFYHVGGIRDWLLYEVQTIVPWKAPEVLQPIFEHQVFIGRMLNNQTTEESDAALAQSAEFYKTHADNILYAARLYPALYATNATREETAVFNLHRPVGDLVMLRTNNRSEAIQYLQGNPMLWNFTGETSQFEASATNPYNMMVSTLSFSGVISLLVFSVGWVAVVKYLYQKTSQRIKRVLKVHSNSVELIYATMGHFYIIRAVLQI